MLKHGGFRYKDIRENEDDDDDDDNDKIFIIKYENIDKKGKDQKQKREVGRREMRKRMISQIGFKF